MKNLAAATVLLALLAPSTLAQGACEAQGGTCVDWRYYICHGGVEQGLCDGDSNNRCCMECDAECKDTERESTLLSIHEVI